MAIKTSTSRPAIPSGIVSSQTGSGIAPGVKRALPDAPVHRYIRKPRGTVYWGGAGMDSPYIDEQIQALSEAGIKNVYRGSGARGYQMSDAFLSASVMRYKDDDDPFIITDIADNPSGQFNLIGYSYGSLIAAQTANYYAHHGHTVDHLVLIGSPIDARFLNSLLMNPNVRRVITINLTAAGDDIFAGMSEAQLVRGAIKLAKDNIASGTTRGIGHFYYRPISQEGTERRGQLAKYLYDQGLR